MNSRGKRAGLAVMVGCAAVLAGCALRHEVTPPSSADAQRVWVAYWSAVERGSVAEWNRVVHSSLRTTGAEGFDPGVQADARSFLALCSVRPEPPEVGRDRASYRTRCAEGPTQSGLFPAGGAEIVLRRDRDGAWRFFCFGCGLPYTLVAGVAPPSPEDAQRLWVAFWSALERRDLDEARTLMHSDLERSREFGASDMPALARSFLYQCSVQPAPPTVAGDRARYRTRCLAGDGDSGPMLLGRDRNGVWKVLCFGNCPL